ncbi:hypothetical protein RRF57_010810 [Xylaria bambusicola]|uniref:Uncharacterized protein n=1 Tax=Xylaria bambusicola TaxID=326684 RepID=A0AAN7UT53_9PEZI
MRYSRELVTMNTKIAFEPEEHHRQFVNTVSPSLIPANPIDSLQTTSHFPSSLASGPQSATTEPFK